MGEPSKKGKKRKSVLERFLTANFETQVPIKEASMAAARISKGAGQGRDRERTELEQEQGQDSVGTQKELDQGSIGTGSDQEKDIEGTPQGHYKGKAVPSKGHDKDTKGTPKGHQRNTKVTPHGQDRVTHRASQGQDRVVTGSGQDEDINRTSRGQDRGVTVTPKGHHNDTTVTPLIELFGAGQEQIKDGTGQGRDRDNFTTKINLAGQQIKIYKWFLSNGLKGRFNKPLIMKETAVAYTTIRKVLRKFENIGLISLSYDDCTKFFDYEINTNIVIGNLDLGQGQDRDRAVLEQERDTPLISSSSLNKNTTTNPDDCNMLDHAIQTDPDLIYWRKRGLSCRQVKKWMDEFQIFENTMLHSLRHAAFDLSQKPEIKKPEAYFRKVLTEAQNYPPPAGFKTHLERQIEQERAILEQEQQMAKELQEIRQKREELEFQNWLDSKGEGFEWCEKNLSSIAKRHKGKQTPVYISNMKSLRKEWLERQKEQGSD